MCNEQNGLILKVAVFQNKRSWDLGPVQKAVRNQKWLIHLRQWHQHRPEAKAKAETKQNQDYPTTTSTTSKGTKGANHSLKKIEKVFSKSSTPNVFPPWRAPEVDECILHWEVSRSVTLSTVGINLVDSLTIWKSERSNEGTKPSTLPAFLNFAPHLEAGSPGQAPKEINQAMKKYKIIQQVWASLSLKKM